MEMGSSSLQAEDDDPRSQCHPPDYSASPVSDLDTRLLRVMRTTGHTPALEKAAIALGKAGNNAVVWVVLGVVLALIDPGQREAWLICAALGPIAIVLNYG